MTVIQRVPGLHLSGSRGGSHVDVGTSRTPRLVSLVFGQCLAVLQGTGRTPRLLFLVGGLWEHCPLLCVYVCALQVGEGVPPLLVEVSSVVACKPMLDMR
jgi:hypothetical protein